jgi:formiminotetrahydrofolate cyclodeaminase
MAARLSPESWAEAAGVAAQAESLRERAAEIVDEDAEAYRRALETRAAADEGEKPERRDWTLGQVTAAAAEPPLALARLAGDVAELCASAASRIEPRVHADVAAAAALAAAVARGARDLVAVNLTALPGDPRVEEADRLATVAEEAAATIRVG